MLVASACINGDWRDFLPWPFTLLCMYISIIRSSTSQFIWSTISEMWSCRQRFTKALLVFLISFSLSFPSVTFSSLSKSLFPYFTDPILKVHTHNIRHMKLSQNLNSLSIVFYRSTCGAITEMGRWWQRFASLVCLSSLVSPSFMCAAFSSSSKPLFPHFDSSTLLHSQSAHMMYETFTKLE